MEDPYFRSYTRDPPHHHHNHQAFHERTTSFFIAVPFIICFSLFGVFNLVGGTVLTVMSCKPKLTPKALASLQRLVRNFRLDAAHIDPMRVVGIMLLVTGSLLVLIGLALGVTACRSISEHERKRRRQLTSSLPLYSLADRRRTSASLSSSPSSFAVPGRGRSNGKKRSLEKTVSPILEASGEYESLECERLAVEIHHVSNTSLRDMSPKHVSAVVCHASASTEGVCEAGESAENRCQTNLSTEIYCHADLPIDAVCREDVTEENICLTVSTDIVCQADLSTDNRCQTHFSAEANCQADISIQAVCHESVTGKNICMKGLPTDIVCQADLSTGIRCQTNLAAEANSQTDLSIEGVCRAGVTADLGPQAGLSINGVQHVYLSTEDPCQERLPVSSVSRNRFICDSDRILPRNSSDSVEIIVADVQNATVNMTNTDDTCPLAQKH